METKYTEDEIVQQKESVRTLEWVRDNLKDEWNELNRRYHNAEYQYANALHKYTLMKQSKEIK